VAALDRWGLLETVRAPTVLLIEHYSFDFGPVVISGTTRPADGHTAAYAPRRTVLDEILIEAAASAGATVRQEFNVDGLVLTMAPSVAYGGTFETGIRRAGRHEL
jgi:flavin-dependent dehydrogenase